jgi:hypothetical protein
MAMFLNLMLFSITLREHLKVVFSLLKLLVSLTLLKDIQIHPVFGLKNKSRHGNLLSMLFMLKVLPSSVRFGMLEEFQIQVCVYFTQIIGLM